MFGRFVPDFGRVVAQMQFDMYHHYTVDEHTIRAIGLLSEIEQGELKEDHPLVAAARCEQIISRRALYVAVLLHDIAKGRGGDHSVLGAEVAEKLCPRFGLTAGRDRDRRLAGAHHLLMSATAFKRDLADFKTILDFVEVVQSPERLRLLLCLTVVDIRAVGPGVWNGWKGALLRELYSRAHELMSANVVADARDVRIARAQEQVRELLPDFTEAEFSAFTQRGYPFYWLSHDPAALARHARMMRQAEQSGAPVTVINRVDTMRS